MPSVSANFSFIAKTVPGMLVLGGILMLVFSLTPLGANPAWGWALIAIGVILWLLQLFAGRNGNGGL